MSVKGSRAGLILAIGGLVGAAAQSTPYSVEELLRETVVRDLALSPDGRRIAIAGDFGGKRDVVAVIDTDHLGESGAVSKFAIGEPGRFSPLWVMWANEKRLLVGLDVASRSGRRYIGRQVEAIDPNGQNPVELFSAAPMPQSVPNDLSRVVDLTPDDPDHIIMAAMNAGTYDLFNVNVYSGAAENLVRGRANTVGWDLKDGKPALRYDSNRRGTELAVYRCDNPSCRDLSLIVRTRRQDNKQDWQYAGDAPGVGMIFARGRTEGADKLSIFRYDLRARAPVEVVAQTPDYDMSTVIEISGEYLGAGYVADTLMYALQDRKLQRHWNGMRNYFNRQANVRIIDVDRARTHMLVHVEGPQAPGDYYLYDLASAQLRFIASDRPWLDPERLAAVEVVKSAMRDGGTITSYLTRPLGGTAPQRLVVVPHGGPEMRDSIDFDPLAQAFAAQGWLVLQPNFRGSSGYGRAFAEAGHHQWARLMQDDVTDAVIDLIKRGVADPKRIAIYGSSYGGYAALMGAVVTPDLYRGAVSLSGLSDLREFLAFVRAEDGAESETYRAWIENIGDPQGGKVAIDAVSPRYRAAEIRIPILLMHGTADGIVPARQSEWMKEALEKTGKSVQYMSFAGEGHRGWSTANQVREIEQAIAFLVPLLR